MNEECPFCGGKIKVRCRCPRADSECENGHVWHLCLAHDEPKVVKGTSDHGLALMECVCKEESS